MCSGRVDLGFVLRAFYNGMDGVFIGGCRLNECNYTTQGNYDALGMVLLCKQLLERVGLNPERLHIAFMSSADGILFTRVTNAFSEMIREIGPLGKAEGLNRETLKLRLDALFKLVPYIRLVERERLRVPERSEKAYRAFFESEDVKRIIDDLILERWSWTQVTTLLSIKPMNTQEISRHTGEGPAQIARHIRSLSEQGLVRFDPQKRLYAMA